MFSISFLVAAVISIWLLLCGMSHLHFALTGQTLVEHKLSGPRCERMSRRGEKPNPVYDMGNWRLNAKLVFGTDKIWQWIFPFGQLKGDGLSFSSIYTMHLDLPKKL